MARSTCWGSMSMSSIARSDPIVAVSSASKEPHRSVPGRAHCRWAREMRVLDERRRSAEGHLGRGCGVQRGTRAGCGTKARNWKASLVIRQLLSEQDTPISLLLNCCSPAGRTSRKKDFLGRVGVLPCTHGVIEIEIPGSGVRAGGVNRLNVQGGNEGCQPFHIVQT